jgi:ADP-ribose pyrophosphatase YjhB (NUDIX family)
MYSSSSIPELPLQRFNLRVYGLWLNPRQELLVTEEHLSRRSGNLTHIFKFPGGGLELGEGPVEGLHREWLEETGQHPTHWAHYYTTHFFQRSSFDPRDQIVSLYYLLQADDTRPLIKLDPTDDVLHFHWWPLAKLNPERLSLPIDQHVARLLLHDHTNGRLAHIRWEAYTG